MFFYFRRLRSRILTLTICSLLASVVLPYDNTIRLFFRWHLHNLSKAIFPNAHHLTTPPPFRLDTSDLGIILKTGFSTQDRLLARLAAFSPALHPKNLVVVGDYATDPGDHFQLGAAEIPVHNALAEILKTGVPASKQRAPRLLHYGNLTAAIADGHEDAAHSIGCAHGWELDIMKHISGLELGYKAMPHKQWYILADDDTYLLDGSLKFILQQLDPSIPHYIGNAVGDFRARFAHGGSAVVLSQAAMHRIFIQNPRIVAAAHLKSLESSWGDKLISTTAMKAGIYLNEHYDRYFNGEDPYATRIRPDRFCAPIVSFHKMSPEEMTDVGSTFQDMSTVVSWIDIWKIYSQSPLHSFLTDPIHANWDHVGELDEATMTATGVETDWACLSICVTRPSACLAWTWDADLRLCHISPWMVVGEPAARHASGINVRRAVRLEAKCVPL